MTTASVPASQFMADPKDERALMLAAIARSARDGQVTLLEAGCGQKWGLVPDGLTMHITGIDLDANALKIRQETKGDLEEIIVGDLRDVTLPVGQFDVVYCSYVLEHVDGAATVLTRMSAALRPGGRMIIRVPDGDSVLAGCQSERHTDLTYGLRSTWSGFRRRDSLGMRRIRRCMTL